MKLVMIAALIATPIAWFAMDSWLSQFAYKMDVSVCLFVGPTLATLVIALLTISFQAIKAALMNPVNSLKTE